MDTDCFLVEGQQLLILFSPWIGPTVIRVCESAHASLISIINREDVAENPYNLEFLDVSTSIIATTLSDYDYGIITGSIVYNAGIDPSTALFSENLSENFWLQVVVKDEDKDTQWAKDIVAAYQSDEFTDWLKANNESEYKNLWAIPEY